jgi:microcystin degradation protein MlrC
VRRLVRSASQTFAGGKVPLGDAAAIDVGGIEIALISNRTQALGTDLFTGLGIDLETKKLICLKSTNHFHAAFAPLASEVLYVDGGGPIPRDPAEVPYTRIKRPIWPLDDDPFG